MSAGTDIVTEALQAISVHSSVQPASPASLQNGFNKLISMVAKWQDDGIKLGLAPLEVIGDELSEPLSTRNGIIYNLALMCAPDHPGAQVSGELRKQANTEFQWIKRRFKKIDIPRQTARPTYPRGQGVQRERWAWDDAFYVEGEKIGRDSSS